MSAGKMAAAAMSVGGAALVFMSFSGANADPAEQAKLPEDVKRSPLKKTLSNAGLYPNPEQPGKRLARTASGSMAVFASGDAGANLTKGTGDPM